LRCELVKLLLNRCTDMKAEGVFNGDPSEIAQSFPKLELKILCCRFWWLKSWEHPNLSFPFWRLYYNFHEGASVEYNHKVYYLNTGKIYLIPPSTAYSSRLYENQIPENTHKLIGGSMYSLDPIVEDSYLREGAIEHLFVHFVLNNTNTFIRPQIFEFPVDEVILAAIHCICNYLRRDNQNIDLSTYFHLHSLVFHLLSKIDEDLWMNVSIDNRIVKVLNYIQNHISEPLSNEILAEIACITPTSFARLFKDDMDYTVQQYIRHVRIDNACSLLHHTDLSIEQIATQTGFTNRYHFTRIFGEVTHTTPARFKKSYTV